MTTDTGVWEDKFSDFIIEEKKDLTIGGFSQQLKRSTVCDLIVQWGFDYVDIDSKVARIKSLLKGNEELFWLYGLALIDTKIQRTLGWFYKHRQNSRKEIKRNFNDYLNGRINTKELKMRVNGLHDKYKVPTESQLSELKIKLKKNWSKDWWSHSTILRDVIIKAVDTLISKDANLPIPDSLLYAKPFDPKAIQEFVKNNRSEETERPIKDICKNVFEHLRLFGLDLGQAQKVVNLYYHHKS